MWLSFAVLQTAELANYIPKAEIKIDPSSPKRTSRVTARRNFGVIDQSLHD